MEEYYIYWNPNHIEGEYLVGTLTFNEEWSFQYDKNIKYLIEKGYHPFFDFLDTSKNYNMEEIFSAFKYRIDENNEPIKIQTDHIILKRMKKE